MSNVSKKKLSLPTVQQPAARWAFVLAVCASLGVVVSYYWRVFYGLDARGVSAAGVTGLCVGLAVLAGAAALALRRVRDFAKKGAACILLCGVLFAFANPPMQTPDETDHYLRTYAISMGRFDFDAQRGYPEDVDELVAAFPGAWVNAHTSAGLGTDPDTHAEQPFNSAEYALKQYGKDGRAALFRLFPALHCGSEVSRGKHPLPFQIPAASGRICRRAQSFRFLYRSFQSNAYGKKQRQDSGFWTVKRREK